MDSFSVIFGAVGAVAGIGGLVLGWLGWRRSGAALQETMRSPVREAQHALLPRLLVWADELRTLLETINYDVQGNADDARLRQDAERLQALAHEMTDPVVVDRRLEELLTKLRNSVIPADTEARGLALALNQYAELTAELAQARVLRGEEGILSVDHVLELGRRDGYSLEPLRVRNSETIEIVEAIRDRLRALERDGLGDFPSTKQLRTR